MRSMTWLAPAVALTLAACGGGDAAAETDMSEANPCAANPCAATDLPVDAIRQGDRELSDHGMSWDISDKTGIFSPFAYASEQ